MTKEIPLTKGMITLVDDDWFDYLSQFSWYAKPNNNVSYAMRDVGARKSRVRVRMHRVIVGAKSGEFVDHIDGNGLNNQSANLRICTKSQNGHNRGPNKNNRAGYKGVYRTTRGWVAKLMVNWANVVLGVYETAEDAAIAYNHGAKELIGEFAFFNKVESWQDRVPVRSLDRRFLVGREKE